LPDEGSEGAFPIHHHSSSDASGTGERASAQSAPPRTDADILPDRIGTVPQDAMDADLPIDDPGAVSVEELAATEDGDDEDEDDPAERPFGAC